MGDGRNGANPAAAAAGPESPFLGRPTPFTATEGRETGWSSDGTGHSDHGRASHAQSASEAWGARQEKDGQDPEKLLHGVASVMVMVKQASGIPNSRLVVSGVRAGRLGSSMRRWLESGVGLGGRFLNLNRAAGSRPRLAAASLLQRPLTARTPSFSPQRAPRAYSRAPRPS